MQSELSAHTRYSHFPLLLLAITYFRSNELQETRLKPRLKNVKMARAEIKQVEGETAFKGSINKESKASTSLPIVGISAV